MNSPMKRHFSEFKCFSTITLKLAIGQETVGMYTVYVHFNRFIDHTINSHTTPYNLVSSRLL